MEAQVLGLPSVLARLRSCLLAPQIVQLAEYLVANGYAPATVEHYVRIAGHFSDWVESRGISPRRIERKHFREFHRTFVQPRKQQPMTESQWLNTRALGNHLLRRLDRPRKRRHPPRDRIQQALGTFACYLRETRGLRGATIRQRCRRLEPLLREHFCGKTFWPERISPEVIRASVIAYSKTHGPDCTRQLTSALRSYYRFLTFRGRKVARQLAAIPCIPAWRTAVPPKVLSASQRRRFLAAFDRSTAIGKRDYAMAICMLELGLRSIDVAALDLNHIDWHRATLTVPNVKQRHPYILPLTTTVGDALADYIRHGRPQTQTPRVFLRHQPPRTALSVGGVHWPMKCAFSRASISAGAGTHILRRSIASQIHASGGGVKEIADFLGHVSLENAGVYARTDGKLLRAFALPWPEGTR